MGSPLTRGERVAISLRRRRGAHVDRSYRHGLPVRDLERAALEGVGLGVGFFLWLLAGLWLLVRALRRGAAGIIARGLSGGARKTGTHSRR